jgi:hypothetical protein
MFSVWYSDILNPTVDGEEKHVQEFEKFGLAASLSAAPQVVKLETLGAIDGFLHNVGSCFWILPLRTNRVSIRSKIRRPEH